MAECVVGVGLSSSPNQSGSWPGELLPFELLSSIRELSSMLASPWPDRAAASRT